MREKQTIFDHIGSVLMIFGFSMVVMMIFCKLFGEPAKEIAGMFQLGSRGLALETMCQYLFVVMLIEILRAVFFSEKLIRNRSMMFRTAGMLGSVLLMMAAVIIAFDWFPVNRWECWAAFLLSFGISFGVSLMVMHLKEKMENKKMEEGLLRLKKELEEKGV